MQPRLLILGAGGHGREVAWTASESGKFGAIGFLDDRLPSGSFVGDVRVVGGIEAIGDNPDAEVVVAIGDPRVRSSVVTQIRARFPAVRFATVIHPSLIRSQSCSFAEGTMVLAGVITTVNVKIGAHVIINSAAALGHEVTVGDCATLGPGCLVCGNAMIAEGVEVGAAAVVKQGLRLDVGSMAAMGAIVMKDVPANTMVLGNPARPIQPMPEFRRLTDGTDKT